MILLLVSHTTSVASSSDESEIKISLHCILVEYHKDLPGERFFFLSLILRRISDFRDSDSDFLETPFLME